MSNKILRPADSPWRYQSDAQYEPQQKITTPVFKKVTEEHDAAQFAEEYDRTPASVAQERYRRDPEYAARVDKLEDFRHRNVEGGIQ